MYSRHIDKEPENLVKNGKPVFGTFEGHPQNMDIRGVKRPYGIIPLPTFITNLRIKSTLSFHFSLGDYTGYIGFFDAKIFGLAELIVWNIKTKQKFSYHSVMGPRKRFVPHDMEVASTSCFKKSRYMRLSWDRTHDKLSVIFDLKGSSGRPSINGALIAHYSSPLTGELTTVSPAPTSRRCSAEYKLSCPVHGAITIVPSDDKPRTMKDCDGQAFLAITRNYMRFHSHGEYMTLMGTAGGKEIALRLSAISQMAVDQDKYNHNVLFVDGVPTPMPPVVITHPFGVMNKWVIQDTENMIDLTFTPSSDLRKIISVAVLRTDYHSVLGSFEGTIMDGSGEKISFKSLPGVFKKYIIRL